MPVTRSRTRRLRKILFVAAATFVVFLSSVPAASAAPRRTIILVVDVSGSMGDNGRLEQAQAALRSSINAFDKQDVVGLHTYDGGCGDGGELIVPPGTGNRDQLRNEVDGLTPGGGTPTPDAIRAAVGEFPDDSSDKVLMLVSDGESSCGDPCPVVTEIQQETGVKFVAHTVGFQTSDEANIELSCIANATGGKYFTAEDQKGIADSLKEALLPPVGDNVSTVLDALPMPSDVPLDAKSVSISAGVGAGLVLLVGFPAELFNRTLEENQRRISRWWRRRSGAGGPAGGGGPDPAGGGGSGPYPPDGLGGPGGSGAAGADPGGGGADYGRHASGAGTAYGQHGGGAPAGAAGMQAGPGGAGGGAYGAGPGAAGADAGAGGAGGASGGAGTTAYGQNSGGVGGGYAHQAGAGSAGAWGGGADPGAIGSGAPGAVGGSGAPGAVGGSGVHGASGGSGVHGATGGTGVGAAGGSGVHGAAGASGATAGPVRSLWASPWILPIFVLISAIASTFVDPESGFNTKSGILLLGFVVAVPLVLFSYAWPNEQVARRASHIPAALKTVPAALGLAIFCTVMSRVSDFVPGYVFGLVLGYVAMRERRLTRAQEGKGVLLGAVTALLVSVGAWVGLEFVHEDAIKVGANTGLVIADTILATTFILGVETVIFGLVPLRVLDGAKLRRWNVWIWAATYAVAILLFVHVLLLNSGAAGSDNDTSVTAAVILFAGFALVSLGFWAWFKYIPDPALMPAFAGPPTGFRHSVPPTPVPPPPASFPNAPPAYLPQQLPPGVAFTPPPPTVPPTATHGAPPSTPPVPPNSPTTYGAWGATPPPPAAPPHLPRPARPPAPPVPVTPPPPTAPPSGTGPSSEPSDDPAPPGPQH